MKGKPIQRKIDMRQWRFAGESLMGVEPTRWAGFGKIPFRRGGPRARDNANSAFLATADHPQPGTLPWKR
ncbi:hypothetical protein GCM10018781_57240 [Kitasatospora indigofera]|uniref:Uncharacterized protein n=1 Tax=Kitasatospora indigofera TaxID=67307 RepID=A0A919L0G9_9ACTN|nr:hypothetical protein GCM10018781_57240 [Kitasatospora indigofera]